MDIYAEIGKLSESASDALSAVACYGLLLGQIQQFRILETTLGETDLSKAWLASLRESVKECEARLQKAGIDPSDLT